ncbi:MAG TPA: DUF2062 domain-containing protein, partial [Bacillota bacterium]|nr:DUF2062 domain-containing protein [Bacillota bacterium]
MKLRRYFRYQYIRVLRLKDTPHKVAQGVALGVALDFLPLPFVSILVAWIIARIARINVLAAVITTAGLKPAVFALFFPFNVLVGEVVTGIFQRPPAHQSLQVAEPSLAAPDTITHFFSLKTIESLGPSFFTGSIINAVVWG